MRHPRNRSSQPSNQASNQNAFRGDSMTTADEDDDGSQSRHSRSKPMTTNNKPPPPRGVRAWTSEPVRGRSRAIPIQRRPLVEVPENVDVSNFDLATWRL